MVVVPIDRTCTIAGGGPAAVEAEKLDIRFVHGLVARFATADGSRLVVIHAEVGKFFSAFRADVTAVDFELRLYCLPSTAIVMDQREFLQVAGVALNAYFACMNARRHAMVAAGDP